MKLLIFIVYNIYLQFFRNNYLQKLLLIKLLLDIILNILEINKNQ